MKARAYHTISALLVLAAGSVQAQIQLGNVDDFETATSSCTTDNWTEGLSSPNPPVATSNCGRLGSCCLVNESAGGFGPGARQTSFNATQWTGDYVAARVNKIQMQVANASADEALNLRIGVTNGSTCYVSTTSVSLAPNTWLQWVSFTMHDTTMTEVSSNVCASGGEDLTTVLTGVTQLRILSAQSQSWNGDNVVSTLHLDDIVAAGDSDLDGINDDADNCVEVPNPNQLDTNGDGYGNVCDADLSNNCVVNFVDFRIFKAAFFTSDPDADLNGDGIVNPIDLTRFKQLFYAEPGPGLGACDQSSPAAIGPDDGFAHLLTNGIRNGDSQPGH